MSVRIYGKPVPPEVEQVLREICASCGVVAACVTSVARTPREQAEVMYENCLRPVEPDVKALYPDPIARQFALYKAPGRSVIQVFVERQAEGRETCVAAMEARINEVGPQLVSRHCAGPDGPVWVIDVGPGSILPERRAAFAAASERHPRVVHFLQPPRDPAFHLEISK